MQIKGWNEPKALLDEAISNGSLKSVIGIIGSSDGIIFSHASGTRDIEYKKRIEIDAIIKNRSGAAKGATNVDLEYFLAVF